jgi:hypothetical protein
LIYIYPRTIILLFGNKKEEGVGGITFVYGTVMLIAAVMVDPGGLHFLGLLAYAAIMLILMPFVGWPILLQAAVYPPAGGSRIGSVLATWIGGTLVGVSVIFWINSVLSCNPARARVDWSGHILVPYWPHLGIALGLLGLCTLVACGVVGAIAPVLRREIALRAAFIGGTGLFVVVYTAGCVLVG